jgi:hypothetical protein
VLVFPDGRVDDGWWRASGHRLTLADIAALIEAGPEVIIAGTGSAGVMEPDPGLAGALAKRGIAFEALPSGEAAARYNALRGKKRVAACFHLTC